MADQLEQERPHSPAFQFYPADWLSDPRLAVMTPAEFGGCVRLFCYMWRDPSCSLPDDDQALAVYSGLAEGWLKGGSRVRDFFTVIDGKRLTHPWLLRERQKQNEWRQKSRQGGLKSGSARRERKPGTRTKDRRSVPKGGSPNAAAVAPAPDEPSAGNRMETDTQIDSKGGSLFSLQTSVSGLRFSSSFSPAAGEEDYLPRNLAPLDSPAGSQDMRPLAEAENDPAQPIPDEVLVKGALERYIAGGSIRVTDDLVRDVLKVANGATAQAVVEFLRRKRTERAGRYAPGAKAGPRSAAWFPEVVKAHFNPPKTPPLPPGYRLPPETMDSMTGAFDTLDKGPWPKPRPAEAA